MLLHFTGVNHQFLEFCKDFRFINNMTLFKQNYIIFGMVVGFVYCLNNKNWTSTWWKMVQVNNHFRVECHEISDNLIPTSQLTLIDDNEMLFCRNGPLVHLAPHYTVVMRLIWGNMKPYSGVIVHLASRDGACNEILTRL